MLKNIFKNLKNHDFQKQTKSTGFGSTSVSRNNASQHVRRLHRQRISVAYGRDAGPYVEQLPTQEPSH